MLEKILRLRNGDNSLKEFIDCIRQGIPSAVFGVTDAFKNFMVSAIDEKVLYVVKDAITARASIDAIYELSGKCAVYIPPKDEILLTSKAFSKDNTYARIRALDQIDKADVVIVTAETLMQSAPKSIFALEIIKDKDLSQTETVKKLVEMG